MQLDKTAIVVAQRGYLDLIDLSLLVVRHFFRQISVCSLICIFPFWLLNLILTYPLSNYELLTMESQYWIDPVLFRLRFYIIQMAIVFLQAPMVLSVLTYLIGQAVFVEQPPLKQVFWSALARWRQILVILGVHRLGLASYLILIGYYTNQEFSPSWEILIYLVCFIGGAYLVRSLRPFAPEILVLERSNLWDANRVAGQPNYSRRSQFLHSFQNSDNFGAHLLLTLISTWTVFCVCGSFFVLIGIIFRHWEWSFWIDLGVLPIACWVAAIWMTIIRFLFYMNSRIRSEGWEVELKLKAEAERLQGATN